MFSFTSYFRDSPYHLNRLRTPFRPPPKQLTKPQIERLLPASVRATLHTKSTWLGLFYILRATSFMAIWYILGSHIPSFITLLRTKVLPYITPNAKANALILRVIEIGLYATYTFLQSLSFTAFWTLAHEAGHMSLSPHKWVNHILGFTMHTFLLVPYFAWRATHMSHHKKTGCIEEDENWVPDMRKGSPLEGAAAATHIVKSEEQDIVSKQRRTQLVNEMIEETPIFALFSTLSTAAVAVFSAIDTFIRICVQQLLGWHAYVLLNARGSPKYPPGTNHFSPSSPLFKPTLRPFIIASNIGLVIMTFLLGIYIRSNGVAKFTLLYVLPYLICNHWIVLLTFLHHTDPTLPHYYASEWTFVRGALATIDRPLLGWAGRFFLHSVSHDHIAHHLFVGVPFWKLEPVTEALKDILKEETVDAVIDSKTKGRDNEGPPSIKYEGESNSNQAGYSYYNYDETSWMRSLWRSWTECTYVNEDDRGRYGAIFYRNSKGELTRALAPDLKTE